MAKYVCSGAKLKCTMGSKESELMVIPTGRCPVFIKGNLVGTIMDYKPIVNIKPFGQCRSLANPIVAAATAANYGRLQPMPCIPNTVTPWIGGKLRVTISGEPTLLENSVQTCMWAGLIEITNPGQDFVWEGAQSLSATTEKVISEAKAKSVAVDGKGADKTENEKVKPLTVKDFAEILEKIESEREYEAARHYASNHINYWIINKLARKYVDETDEEKKEEEKDNDPNLMPSRFMILYGADDEKLEANGNKNDYPDGFDGEPEHKMSVAKLREALIYFGNDNIKETGPFDNDVYFAFLQYLRRYSRVDYNAYFPEDALDIAVPTEHFAGEHGVFTWKYFEEDGHERDHESVIEALSPALGDRLLAEKGVNPRDYLPGVCYRYPWVPFDADVVSECKIIHNESVTHLGEDINNG
jgi:hypothetical protein